MKFERIKSNKKLLISGIIILIIGVTIIITTSLAAYKKTTTITISEGTVNYVIPDMKIMALKQWNSETNEYEDIDTMPNGNDYAINSDSYCEVFDEKDENVKLYTNSSGEHVITNIQKNSRCYFYFAPTAKSIILANSAMGSETPNFANTSCTNGTNKDYNDNSTNCEEQKVGLYCWDVNTNRACTDTSVNKTYFFRGNVTDNYVEFAGHYWRIIRINENGSIRMIYSGNKVDVDAAGKETVLANGYDDTDTELIYISLADFNGYDEDQMMNAETIILYSSSYNEFGLYEWYEIFIDQPSLGDYIDPSAGFCADTSGYVLDWGPDEYGNYNYHFGVYDRLFNTNPNPTFSCAPNNLNTIAGSGNGNGVLNYPIGLLTADEVIFAGASGTYSTNMSFYLYSGWDIGTMSPCEYDNSDDYGNFCHLTYSGYLDSFAPTGTPHTVRPVINLKGNVPLSGLGTIQEPYKVVAE